MFFDPIMKPEVKVETKPEPSLEGFIAWLEKQPPERMYDYDNIRNCAICQYARSLGHVNARAGGNYFRENESSPVKHDVVPMWSGVVSEDPWTFGAALERARKVLAARR